MCLLHWQVISLLKDAFQKAGLGLYVATIALLPLAMGKFHVATVVITWIAFQQINLHNHDLWEATPSRSAG